MYQLKFHPVYISHQQLINLKNEPVQLLPEAEPGQHRMIFFPAAIPCVLNLAIPYQTIDDPLAETPQGVELTLFLAGDAVQQPFLGGGADLFNKTGIVIPEPDVSVLHKTTASLGGNGLGGLSLRNVGPIDLQSGSEGNSLSMLIPYVILPNVPFA